MDCDIIPASGHGTRRVSTSYPQGIPKWDAPGRDKADQLPDHQRQVNPEGGCKLHNFHRHGAVGFMELLGVYLKTIFNSTQSVTKFTLTAYKLQNKLGTHSQHYRGI